MTIEIFIVGQRTPASNNAMEVLSRWKQCNAMHGYGYGYVCVVVSANQVKCNCHSCTKQKLFDSLHLLTEKFLFCLCLNFSQIV